MVHRPICGFNYDPPDPEPVDNFVIGERYVPRQPVMPDSDNPFVIGGEHSEITQPGCGADCAPRMMMMMNTSGLPVIGYREKRRRRRRQAITFHRYWE